MKKWGSFPKLYLLTKKEHAERTKQLALKLGKKLGLDPKKLKKLTTLSSLHDVGKVVISEKILRKDQELTDEEWREMKKHPEYGYRVVKAMKNHSHVADEILSHHERWDGTGYPKGLKGEEIPLLSRIISIVDSYDVMTHKRDYNEPMNKEEAIKEIKQCSGTQFDPNLTEKFIQIISEE